jgi:hypothetical protein
MVLARGGKLLMNTLSPSEACWAAVLPDLVELPIHQGVLFGSCSHTVTVDGLQSREDEQWMVIQEEELPIDRIRLVAPPELPHATRHTLPARGQRLSLEVLRGERTQIPLPDPDTQPSGITLQPGEIVELHKE